MKFRKSFCEIMIWVKAFAGVAILIAGWYQQNWIGLIGFIPLLDFWHYQTTPSRQSCEVKSSKYDIQKKDAFPNP